MSLQHTRKRRRECCDLSPQYIFDKPNALGKLSIRHTHREERILPVSVGTGTHSDAAAEFERTTGALFNPNL